MTNAVEPCIASLSDVFIVMSVVGQTKSAVVFDFNDAVLSRFNSFSVSVRPTEDFSSTPFGRRVKKLLKLLHYVKVNVHIYVLLLTF